MMSRRQERKGKLMPSPAVDTFGASEESPLWQQEHDVTIIDLPFDFAFEKNADFRHT